MSAEPTTNASSISPAYAGRFLSGELPRHEMPAQEAPPEVAYRFIRDELMLDGNARLNQATFVTTWMEPQAEALMAESFDKNMIDKDEYPATAEIERRCVNIVGNLFHAKDAADGNATGVSTIGSSEAVMLAGLAMKWRWRARQEAAGKPADKPNLVLGTNVQVVWEKFCRYWDVEPKYIPMKPGRYVISPEEAVAHCDENTIGVVAILGTTFTGENEPIEAIHDAVVALNQEKGWAIPIHVDAASGGFVAPFLHPDLKWDFRLPNVASINVSGHKYGLVYPGIGFVVWRQAEDLPEDLVFRVNYLGGDMPTFTLNFSRPGNQIVGQYYNFIRLGRAGYTAIMSRLQSLAKYVADGVKELPQYEVISDGTDIPVLSFKVADDVGYTVFDVSDYLRRFGWQVPAYTMPADAEDVAVLRVVVREGFSRELADALLKHITDAHEVLSKGQATASSKPGFAHL